MRFVVTPFRAVTFFVRWRSKKGPDFGTFCGCKNSSDISKSENVNKKSVLCNKRLQSENTATFLSYQLDSQEF